jgi:predicted Rossmann fold nucleotide-binding protein DprA/Smf involved in DNA uptake
MTNEIAYWIALSQLPRWESVHKNNLVIKFHSENKITISEFFNLPEQEWKDKYLLKSAETEALRIAREEAPGISFLVEDMLNQGFEFIPIISPYYSATLKNNLKTAYSPTLLFVKGNKQLMQEKTVAIVGSREASGIALDFTDKIARKSSREYKVVVSGFAKGVDRQALDSAIACKGQSIIVLPQGILTFGSGFNDYYRQITNGDVLVLSTFNPKTPWRKELAMARNSTIYGLADEIFVAESSEKGGTWSGVKDGIQKGRTIYVRMPGPDEMNANKKLIALGAIPVDQEGNPVAVSPGYWETNATDSQVNELEESLFTGSPENFIRTLLAGKAMSMVDILQKTNKTWPDALVKQSIKGMRDVEIIKRNGKNYYKLSKTENEQKELF